MTPNTRIATSTRDEPRLPPVSAAGVAAGGALVAATHWVSIFTAISAGAAAVAAIAACAAVVLEHRARNREREPLLMISVAEILGQAGPQRITVENGGGGVAHEVFFIAVSGGCCALGGLPPTSTLGPGKRVVLDADYPPGGSEVVTAMVVCRYRKYLIAWDAAGQRKRARLGRHSGPSKNDLFRHFYPDAPDVDQLRPAAYTVVDKLSSP